MAYSQLWLEGPTSIRGLFVEVQVKDLLGAYGTAGSEVTLFLANVGYMTANASISYLPYLTGNLQTTESLSIDGSLSMSFGDIEIANPNGERDNWLDSTKFIWVNRPIQIYLGDPRWVTADLTAIHTDFELVFNGIVADLDSSSRESLNLKVRDKLQKLNEPVTDSTIGTYGVWGGGQTNQDTIKPIILGEVFNISPVLIDPSTLEYMVNDGNTELVIEIRDNGAPVYTDVSVYTGGTRPSNATVTLSTGKFKLLKPSSGSITVSVQGIKRSINLTTGAVIEGIYTNNIASIIALLVTQYGPTASRLVASDLDLINLAAFAVNVNNTQAIGTAVLDRTNVLTVCQDILSSTYAQMFMNRKGLLQLLQLGIYTSDPIVYITDNTILLHSLQVSSKTEVVAATKIGYAKNYTPQTSLVASLPSAHNVMFTDEWYSSTVVDTTVQSTYRLDSSPVQKDTALIKATDALALATRLNAYFKVSKIVYSFTGTSGLLSLKLGQQVNLTHNRFGLSSGKMGQVISLSPNWVDGTINIEVII